MRFLCGQRGRWGKGRSRGFSLIELMVVMGLIVLIGGIALVSVQSIGGATGARGAADLASSLVLAARYEALSFGKGSRLAIDNGNKESTKLRRIFLLRGEGESGAVEWKLANKPQVLPKGVLFLPEDSQGYIEGEIDIPNVGLLNVIYYEWRGNGQLRKVLASDAGAKPGLPKLVFTPTALDGSGQPITSDASQSQRVGFLLRTNGRPVYFKTPEQIDSTGTGL